MLMGDMHEEIQVPPDFVQCVIPLTPWAPGFGTSKLTSPGRIDVDIEPFLLRITRDRWPQSVR